MITGIDLNQRIEFVSVTDEGEPKTIFVLRLLSSAEIIDLGNTVQGGLLKLAGKAIIDLVDLSIVEVKNFQPDMPKRQIVESLPPDVLGELVIKITELNHITAADKKKS